MLEHLLSWLLVPLLWHPTLPVDLPFFNSNRNENRWRVETIATSSDDVIVRSGNGATSTETIIHAPYGVRSEIVSINGKTYATTTPITEADIREMRKQSERMRERQRQMMEDMNRMLDEHRQFMDEIWRDFY